MAYLDDYAFFWILSIQEPGIDHYKKLELFESPVSLTYFFSWATTMWIFHGIRQCMLKTCYSFQIQTALKKAPEPIKLARLSGSLTSCSLYNFPGLILRIWRIKPDLCCLIQSQPLKNNCYNQKWKCTDYTLFMKIIICSLKTKTNC